MQVTVSLFPAWLALCAGCAISAISCGGSAVHVPAADQCVQQLPELWGDHPAIGEGAVTIYEQDDVRVFHVDATAGGMAAARTSAFVFVDLNNGQLELSEEQAADSVAWHLAFRRAQLRVNGGTSGPSDVRITRIHGVSLDTVSRADVVDANWHSDQSLAADCSIRRDPIGQPMTAIHDVNADNPSGSHSWYNYGPDGVVPMPDIVYAVRGADDAVWAFSIDSWQDGAWILSVRSL